MIFIIKNHFKLISAIAALAVLSGYQTVSAGQAETDSFLGKDKLEHFAISAAMTASTAFVLHNHFKTKKDDAIVIGFLASFSLGGVKELVDKRIPGEKSSWKDLVADFIGCAAGAIIIGETVK